MVDLKIRLEVNEDSESEKIGSIVVDATSKISNCSIKVDDSNRYIGNPSPTFKGQEGLSFARGYLPFNSNGYLANEDTQKGVLLSEQNPREFIWGAVDNDGYYDVTIILTKGEGGSNIDKIVIYGDEVANQFPTQAIIDGTQVIYSDDPIWRIGFEEASDTHTIRFLKWNRPNYNACIARIMVMMQYYDIDKFTGLKSVESLSECASETSDVSYGVISSSGSIEILDRDGEIFEMIKDNVITKSNLAVEILLNNNIIQKHITIDSKYSNYNKTLSLSLSNKLLKLDKLKYSPTEYENLLQDISAYDLFVKLLKNIYTEYAISNMMRNMTIYNNQEITIEDYLKEIIFKFIKIDKSKPIRELVGQICQVAQVGMFENDNGDIELINLRPVFTTNTDVIKIEKKDMFSQLEYNVFNKQSYDRVDIQSQLYTGLIDSSIFTSNSFAIMEKVDGNWQYAMNFDIDNNYRYTDSNGYKFHLIVPSVSEFFDEIEISYSIDLDKLDKLFNVKDLEKLKYNITETRHIYSWSPKKDETVDVGEIEITYNLDAGENKNLPFPYFPPYNYWYIEDNKLNILFNFKSCTHLSGGYDPSDANYHSYYYVTNLKFDVILPNTYQSDYVTKIHGKTNSEHALTISSDFLSSQDGIIDILANNILSDFKQGILYGTLTICCSDLYNLNGELAIDWENKKQIIKTGTIIKIHNNNFYWRIISRKFAKTGAPMLDLYVQQVKMI